MKKTLDNLALESAKILKLARSPNTIRAYKADWADFENWCSSQGLDSNSADPQALALFLTDRASSLKQSTLRRRLAAINVVYGLKGVPSPGKTPLIQDLVKGLYRRSNDRIEKKKALSTDELLQMTDSLPDDLRGHRDKSILLLGFSGALRRSEISNLDLRDLVFVKEGLICTVRNTKTDQSSAGEQIAILRSRRERSCPVRALEFWLEFSELSLKRQGPVFRGILPNGVLRDNAITGRAIAQIIQRAARRIGMDETRVGGHSLRSGMATEAARKGVGERIIQKQTRHKSIKVLRGYIRDGELFKENATKDLGL